MDLLEHVQCSYVIVPGWLYQGAFTKVLVPGWLYQGAFTKVLVPRWLYGAQCNMITLFTEFSHFIFIIRLLVHKNSVHYTLHGNYGNSRF